MSTVDKFEIDIAIDLLASNEQNSVEGLEYLRRVLYKLALGSQVDRSVSDDEHYIKEYLNELEHE